MPKKREIQINNEVHKYSLRRSKRAKHILIHVEAGGKIELVVPGKIPEREAEEFLWSKKEWLVSAVSEHREKNLEVPKMVLWTGSKLPLLGDSRKLEVVLDKTRKRDWYVDGSGFVRVYVSDKKNIRTTLIRWYKREARDYYAWQVEKMGKKIGRKVKKIVISDARSQWGSCNKTSGRISLQWRLLLGPKAVTDYVIAHEVAHLEVAAHNPPFWRLVGRLDTEYMKHKKWLRRWGHTLEI